MITTLTLCDFRGFRDLTLDGLQRVNLIVGPNNCGKTSLLEGICLLCEPERANELPGRLRAKGKDDENRYFRWLLRDGAGHDAGRLTAWASGRTAPLSEVAVRNDDQRQRRSMARPDGLFHLVPGEKAWTCVHDGRRTGLLTRYATHFRCCIISTEPRPAPDLVTLFGKAQRILEGEETLTALLRQVDPRIRKIRIDPDPQGNQIIVDVGLSELLPLAQVGQGVQRLVAIFSEVIGDKPGVALVDEIENGVHHAVHETVWAGLAAMAEKLEVQVFATTHSEECLEAAHRAFAKRPNYDFSVIRLFRVESGPQGRVLDRKHIEAALAGDIDLR